MIEIPPKVAALLDGALRRVRWIYIARGIVASLAVFLFSSLVVMGIDACATIYSDPLRWAMSLGVYTSSLAAFAFAALRPLFRRIDRLKIAKILDERHEENEECLTTLVDLSLASEHAERVAASTAFIRMLAAHAERCAEKIDVKKEFTARTVVRRLFALGAVALVFLCSFIAQPRLVGMLFLRTVAPWADVGNLYADAIRVTPGDIDTLAGEKIVIKASVEKGFAYEKQIRISRRTALGWGDETVESMRGGEYTATADLSDREWRYRVSAGPAVTKYFFVRVHEKPEYKAFSAKVEYPSYTGFSPLVISNEAVTSISAIEGARVTFDITLDHRVSKAYLKIAGKESSSWTMISTNSAKWSLQLENAALFRSPKRTGVLKSVPDMPPSVVIEKPQRSVRVPPHAKVPFIVTAIDDTLGLSNELLVRIGGGTWRSLRALEKFSHSGASLWKGEDELDLSLLDLEGQSRLEFAVLVRDARPDEMGGSHCVTSTPVVVSLESKAESFALQSLAEEEKKFNAIIDEAKKRLAAAVHPSRSAAARIKREKTVSETTNREISKSAHETREAAKRIDEFRERVEADTRLKPLEKTLKEVIEEKLSAVLEQLKTAQFASPQERGQALEKVPEKINEAIKKVKELEEELKARMAQLKNHERMEDLARRQEALARSAKAALRRDKDGKSDTRMMEAWKRMQREAAAKAKELSSLVNDAQIDEARRRMEKAASLMDREKSIEEERMRNANKPQVLENLAKARERREDSDKFQSMRKALAAAKTAEKMMRESAKMNNPRPAADAMHKAMNAQREAQDELEKASVNEEGRFQQHEAEKALREALDAAQQARKAGEEKDDTSRERTASALAEMKQLREKALSHQQAARALMEKALAEAEKGEEGRVSSSERSEDANGGVAEKAAQAAQAMKESVEKAAERFCLNSDMGLNTAKDRKKSQASLGGVAAELESMMHEMKSVEMTGDIKELLRREGWFLIKGSAKDGIGTIDINAVSPEYRELVRLYFLKLAEENR